MAESETGADTSVSVTNKWPGYCKTFLVKEPNGNIKELVFPKALDLDRPKRDRTTFSSRQLKQLEEEFMCNQYVVGKDRTRLAKTLGLTETQVKVWFQNRRTKLKKDNERKDSETDPQAESKAAQNVLKLLSLRTSSAYPNFQSKQTIPQQQTEDAEPDSPPQRMTSSPEFSKSALTKGSGDAFRVTSFNDVYSAGFKGVSVSGNFTHTVPAIDLVPQAPLQVIDTVMNQSRANCQFPVSAIPSFGARHESNNHEANLPEVGPLNAIVDMTHRPTDNTALFCNSGERPSPYFGQGEVFLPQFTSLPSWLGDYQRLNLLRHSSTHWHHNQRQTSHFGAQQTLSGSRGVHHAYQNHNVYREVHPSSEQWAQQMSAAPAGYVWRYVHPAHIKTLEFRNQSNGPDGM